MAAFSHRKYDSFTRNSPYCIVQTRDSGWLVRNRYYNPIGRIENMTEELAIQFHARGPADWFARNKVMAPKTDNRGDSEGQCFYLYDAGNHPAIGEKKNVAAYNELVRKLKEFKIGYYPRHQPAWNQETDEAMRDRLWFE